MSRRVVVTFLVAVALVTAPAAPAAAAVSARGLYVWDATEADVMDVALAKGRTELYAHVPPGAAADPRLLALVERSHAAGLQVQALGGDPRWAEDHRAAASWATGVVATGRYDALHLDIEPWVLPGWHRPHTQRRLVRGYLAALAGVRARAGGLPVVAAVPFWFDEIPGVRQDTLLADVVATVDGIVVMAYRDTLDGPDGILAHARAEVDAAESAGIRAVIALETVDTGIDKVDFSAEGDAALAAALAGLDAAFTGHPGYGGTAVHELRSWRTLRP